MKKTKKLPTISKLKKKADQVFSLWVRARDKRCFTCDSTNSLQNGHYMSRTHTNTRYDEKNCNAQCVACNMFRGGNMPIYAIRLVNKYGQDILKELYRKAHTYKKCDREFLNEIISKYETN